VHGACVVDAVHLLVKKYSLTNSPRVFFLKIGTGVAADSEPEGVPVRGRQCEAFRQI
jgi:hypothetical protein